MPSLMQSFQWGWESGADCARWPTLVRPGDRSVVTTTTGDAPGIRQVEVRMLLTMVQCTARPPTKNALPPAVKRGEAEEPARSQDRRTKCLRTTALPCGSARVSERGCPPAEHDGPALPPAMPLRFGAHAALTPARPHGTAKFRFSFPELALSPCFPSAGRQLPCPLKNTGERSLLRAPNLPNAKLGASGPCLLDMQMRF